MAPRMGRFGPPGTVHLTACQRWVANVHGVCIMALTNVLPDMAANLAFDSLHVIVPADVANRVALTLRDDSSVAR